MLDSLGVEIISLDAMDAAGSWTLDEVPVWSFSDSIAGPLHQVRHLRAVTSDRIAIFDGSRSMVVVLDNHGNLIGRGGARGAGPGEFRRAGLIVPRDSTRFSVLDPITRILSDWNLSAAYLGQAQLPDLTPQGRPVAISSPGGVFLSYLPNRGGPTDVVLRGSGPVVAWNDGAVDTVTTLAGAEYITATDLAIAPAFGAEGIIAGNGTGVWVGDTRQAQVDHWADGRLARVVRWPALARFVTDEMNDQWIDSIVSLVPQQRSARLRDMLNGFPRVGEVPQWQRMFATRAGRIWISDYAGPALPPQFPSSQPQTRWLVLEDDGRPLSGITTPAGFEPFDVLGDVLVGVWTDELGVESVRALRIRR